MLLGSLKVNMSKRNRADGETSDETKKIPKEGECLRGVGNSFSLGNVLKMICT